jgi:hypothetical protein
LNGSCEVSTTTAYDPPAIRTEKVRGKFKIGHTGAGLFAPRFDVVAFCDGVKVKELKNLFPLYVGDVDLGTLAP